MSCEESEIWLSNFLNIDITEINEGGFSDAQRLDHIAGGTFFTKINPLAFMPPCEMTTIIIGRIIYQSSNVL